jgi:glycosyltransferase involved in cell wall biosynthesis
MATLYKTALALVFPSLFEGFGLPVAEAIVSGCPVACSKKASLPEIAGSAALMFDPLSVSDIAMAITDIVTKPELRAHLIEEGRARRSLFSPWLQAIKTMAIYQRTFDELYS